MEEQDWQVETAKWSAEEGKQEYVKLPRPTNKNDLCVLVLYQDKYVASVVSIAEQDSWKRVALLVAQISVDAIAKELESSSENS